MELPSRKHPARLPLLYDKTQPNIIFLTVCTAKRKPILANAGIQKLITEAWISADHWHVGHYLIMPDHIHLFCSPSKGDCFDIKAWIKYWKSLASRKWPRKSEHPVWQTDFWDTQLRSSDNYTAKWDYVQQNPIKAGLVDEPNDWPYKGKLNDLYWH